MAVKLKQEIKLLGMQDHSDNETVRYEGENSGEGGLGRANLILPVFLGMSVRSVILWKLERTYLKYSDTKLNK